MEKLAMALQWFGLNATQEQRKQAKQLSQAKRLSYVFNCYLAKNEV